MYWKCPVSIGNVLLEKSIKDFLNLLDWHTASAVKDTFIISDIQKNKYKKTSPGRKKKADTAKLSSNFEKKSE